MRKERVEKPTEGVGSHTPVTGRGIKSDVGYLGIFSVGPDPVLGSASLHSILISVRTSAITAMRNHLFVFLVVLIFSVSLNLSQCEQDWKLEPTRETEKLKPNIRRASGLINYPRIGRSNLNFNRRGMEPDTDFQFYSTELDPDKDYEDSPASKSLERSMYTKHADRIPKEASWLISDRVRSSKDGSWKIDEGRSIYPAALLLNSDSRNSQVNGYTPRLGRGSNDADRILCK
ncbi:CAPA peptides-like isoform X2 [Apis florea]|uniref:CAPA peptides-like isoform X2 n=1 Tax=Apis florea TaxID=7463 RepID=UPI0012FF32B6|nr:CAPA peptides-like isoform X2 [Apis florea]